MNICPDCGAYSEWGKVRHYDTCEPGSAKKWEAYYASDTRSTRKMILQMVIMALLGAVFGIVLSQLILSMP